MTEIKKIKTIAEKESEVLNFWNEHKIFEKSLFENNKNKDGKVAENNFKFYDGPPFATGLPHPGHLLQSYLKDSIPRYQTMKGNYVRRAWGWDCHGLPIENLIEKELDLKTKKDLVDFGVDKFTKACNDIVLKYDSDWKRTVPVWGRWVDMENQYATVNNTYTESCWWAFSELYKKGLAYEGFKVMHICPRCETPLAASEVALGYQDVKDLSVYVKFELADEPGTFLLAWTTTPWTLPGNTAIAINKNLNYQKIKVNNETLIIAESLVSKVLAPFPEGEGLGMGPVFGGAELLGKRYKPVFDYYNNPEFIGGLKNVFGEPNGENIYKVWHADFVTAEQGTGIAHEAPAFGEDDYNLAMQHNIPTILHVGMDGRFVKDVVDFAGERVKWKGETQATDKKVCEFLQNQNKILKTEVITHSYPMCWRCDTPLLNYATNSWFVAVSKMRDRLVEENNKVYWVPDHVREGRMGEWLKGARDWALSRNRYWGAPLPVWKSVTNPHDIFIPGSLKELQQRTKAKNKYIFIRHGESEPNLTGKINVDKSKNFGLTENGKKQLSEPGLTQRLRDYKIDIIVSSPYLRTKETAEIISNNLELDKNKIIVEDKLQEFQVGMKNDGRTWQEMYYESKEKINLYHDKIDGADEAKIDVVKRVAKFLSECEEKYEGKTILCITHNSPMSAVEIFNNGELYERATGNLPKIHKFQNAEILELDFHPLPVDETGAVNFHIPHIDNLKVYDDAGNLMKREGGVFDCWYESGSMPYAQFHYPFENKELFKQNFPADFISEAQDQTRGWFYTMLVLGVGLFDQSPFKSVITSGMINAADGKKISKKLKNYTDPLELIKQYGSDSVRYYLLSSPAVKGESMKFSDEGVKQIYSKNITRLLNVVSFYKMYESEVIASSHSQHVLDKYIVARLKQVKLEVSKGFDELFVDVAFRPIEKFIDDLSVWFLRRSRDRFKSDDEKTRNEAVSTTLHILREFAKVLAPIMPFTAEMIWAEVKNKLDPESVHLCAWGNVEELENSDIEAVEKMELVREMVTNILEERNKAGIKVRQPLASATFKTSKFDLIKNSGEYLGEVMEETNVKSLKFVNSDRSAQVCELDTKITEELKVEGVYRELVRTIQDARKLAGLKVGENVNIQLPNSTDDFSKKVVAEKETELKKECNLNEISWGEKLEILK